jgi:hypothetical protein
LWLGRRLFGRTWLVCTCWSQLCITFIAINDGGASHQGSSIDYYRVSFELRTSNPTSAFGQFNSSFFCYSAQTVLLFFGWPLHFDRLPCSESTSSKPIKKSGIEMQRKWGAGDKNYHGRPATEKMDLCYNGGRSAGNVRFGIRSKPDATSCRPSF